MFEWLPLAADKTVTIDIDGAWHEVPAHVNVAAAMLSIGVAVARTSSVSGTPRGPFCMMGVCFECLVEIDGVPNQQGCCVQVRDGMHIRAMRGRPAWDALQKDEA